MIPPFYVRRVCEQVPTTATDGTFFPSAINIWHFDVIEAASGERVARCSSRDWADRIAASLRAEVDGSA